MRVPFLVLVALAYAFCFVCFSQRADLAQTAAGSLALLKGHFLDFYTYNQSVVGGSDYPLTIYVLFALWNIPLVLLRPALPGMDGLLQYMVGSQPILMYEKVLPLIFFLLTIVLVERIVHLVYGSKDLSRLAVMLYSTSLLAVFSPLLFGQYDSIYVFFALAGLYALLKVRNGNYLVPALLFAASISVKPFAAFFFIPILLILEKRVVRLAVYVAVAVAPYFLLGQGLLFAAPAAEGAGATTLRFAAYLYSSMFGINWKISVFLVVWIFLCGYCFFKVDRTLPDLNRRLIHLCTLTLTAFFVLCFWHPQWTLLLAPFLAMAVVAQKDRYRFYLIDAGIALTFSATVMTFWPNHLDRNLIFGGVLSDLGFVFSSGFSNLSLYRLSFGSGFVTVLVGLLLLRTYLTFTTKEEDPSVFRLRPVDTVYVAALFLVSLATFVVPILAGIVLPVA